MTTCSCVLSSQEYSHDYLKLWSSLLKRLLIHFAFYLIFGEQIVLDLGINKIPILEYAIYCLIKSLYVRTGVLFYCCQMNLNMITLFGRRV